MSFKRSAYTIIFLVAGYSSFAQVTDMPVVSGEFKNITTEQFLLQLETRTGLHFYFDTSQLDSATINISVDKTPLPEVLKLAFLNTNVGFAYDRENNFFVSKGQVVQTELPKGFFGGNENNKNNTSSDTTADYPNFGSSVKNTTQQNKLYQIGERGSSGNAARNTITGFILDNKTGEPVIGASVRVENTGMGGVSDQYGYYIISLPKGRYTLSIQSIGMRDTKREIMVNGDGKFNIEMQTQVIALKKVVVSAEKASNIRSLQMGVQKIDIKTIKQVPVVFG
ncbi:MAG: carboxypeptidase-like regulatory domain-containing protein, partial [Ginsengibacter sp.]